jgi:hypothetical protein
MKVCPKCFKGFTKEFSLNSDVCIQCDNVIHCLMRLYDEPLPTLVLYSSGLLKKKEVKA